MVKKCNIIIGWVISKQREIDFLWFSSSQQSPRALYPNLWHSGPGLHHSLIVSHLPGGEGNISKKNIYFIYIYNIYSYIFLWLLPLGVWHPPSPLIHFLHYFLLQLNLTFMKLILHLFPVKTIIFKSSYNWFKIDILRLLWPSIRLPTSSIFSHIQSHLNYCKNQIVFKNLRIDLIIGLAGHSGDDDIDDDDDLIIIWWGWWRLVVCAPPRAIGWCPNRLYAGAAGGWLMVTRTNHIGYKPMITSLWWGSLWLWWWC